jgi:hypothetical protein
VMSRLARARSTIGQQFGLGPQRQLAPKENQHGG